MLRRVLGLLLVTAVVASCGGGTETSQGRTRNLSATCFSTSEERDDTLKVLTFSVSSLTEQLSAMRPLGELQQVADLAAKNLEVASSELTARQVAWATELQLVQATNGELTELNRLFIAKEQQFQIVVSMQDLKYAADDKLAARLSVETQLEVQSSKLQYAEATPLCAVPEDATASTLDEGTTTSAAESGGDASVTTLGDTSTTVADNTTTSVAESGGDASVTTLGDSSTTIETQTSTTNKTQKSTDENNEVANDLCNITRSAQPRLWPNHMVVGEKVWVGLPGCTVDDLKVAGLSQVWTSDQRQDGILVARAASYSLDGDVGWYVQFEAVKPGFADVGIILYALPDYEKLREFQVMVRVTAKGQSLCAGKVPNASFDQVTLRWTVEPTCSEADGVYLKVNSTRNGHVVNQTPQSGVPNASLVLDWLFRVEDSVSLVATHICKTGQGDGYEVCGETWRLDDARPAAPAPSKPSVNPCLDSASPTYNCGWALIDASGSVKAAVVCNFAKCGSGSYAGSPVVLQSRAEPSGAINLIWNDRLRYDSAKNRFYPDGIPGPWFTGGDEWSDIQASLQATALSPTTTTTLVPATSTSTTAPLAGTATSVDVTTTSQVPVTSTTMVSPDVQPDAASSKPSAVVTPLPAAALQREVGPASQGASQGVPIDETPLPIPVVDGATAMICDERCISDAKERAGASADASVEIEVAKEVWVPAEDALIPVNPSGTPLRVRVTPKSGDQVILGGEVVSASEASDRSLVTSVVSSSDGTVSDLAGNVIDSVDVVEAATTETSGIALWFAAILAMLALVIALFIAFLVKFFLKGRKSVAPTGDQADQDGRT